MPVAKAGYRAEVDGLRAVAVVAVVLFHLEVPLVRGGFVGVDVFFVISGYLITRLLHAEAGRSGRISLLGFYERRIRRIVPALAVMLLAVSIAGIVLLVPSDLKNLGRTVAYAATSTSNIEFARGGGYFDRSSLQQPLLHTWSLAVEEQFYLVFPLLFGLGLRYLKRHAALVVGAFVAASLVAAYLLRDDATRGFYLPFGRFWEIGLGGLLAVAPLPRVLGRLGDEVLAAVGLALILFAVLRFDGAVGFPWPQALVPCMGAGLLLHATAGGPTFVGRVLSLRPVVGLGLVSYSLYLWHWPVIVLTRLLLGRPLDLAETVLLLVAVLALSVLSWRFVEGPTRRARWVPRRAVFASAAVVLGAATFVGYVVVGNAGLPSRFSRQEQRIAAIAGQFNPDRARCDSPSLDRVRSGDVCVLGAPGVEPRIAVVGDSFGDATMPAIVQAARAAGKSFFVFTRAGCRPILGATPSCEAFEAAVGQRIAATPSIDRVLTVGRWATMITGVRYGFGSGPPGYMRDAQSRESSAAETARVFERLMTRTVASYGGKPVTALAFQPEQRMLVPQTVAMRTHVGLPVPAGVSRSAFDERQKPARRVFADLEAARVLKVIDVSGPLCDAVSCPAVAAGVVRYRDDNHLSNAGSLLLVPTIAPFFAS
jgi:peptidoglycan/LPS O-acetylase OafA/YrhL